MFSKTCKYAIRAAIFIAFRSLINKRASLITIAKGINSPKAFTAKILQILVKNDILKSTRGPHGGFFIDKKMMKKISIGDVVTSIDGDKLFTTCGLGIKNCSNDNPCPIHFKWLKMKDDLRDILYKQSLYELAKGQKEKLYVLL